VLVSTQVSPPQQVMGIAQGLLPHITEPALMPPAPATLVAPAIAVPVAPPFPPAAGVAAVPMFLGSTPPLVAPDAQPTASPSKAAAQPIANCRFIQLTSAAAPAGNIPRKVRQINLLDAGERY
jgi:hypothetical protein